MYVIHSDHLVNQNFGNNYGKPGSEGSSIDHLNDDFSTSIAYRSKDYQLSKPETIENFRSDL